MKKRLGLPTKNFSIPLDALKVTYRKGEKASTFSFTVKQIARKLFNS